MPGTRIVKLFTTGAGQAVRLPAEFRFEATEVFATCDQQTGDVALSTRLGVGAWKDFFALVHTIDVAADFMAERPMNVPPPERGVLRPTRTASSKSFPVSAQKRDRPWHILRQQGLEVVVP